MSKYLKPKAWYLLAIGAAALAFDGVRRLLKKRQEEAEYAATNIGSRDASFAPAPAEAVKTKTTTAVSPAAKAAQPSGKRKDDLTEIKGIGPVYAERLTEAGITTFAALAKTSPERLREVTNATAAADPDEWIAQARLK